MRITVNDVAPAGPYPGQEPGVCGLQIVSRAVNIARSGQNVALSWAQGLLQQAPAMTGPWTTNNTATSPYTVPAVGSRFYRLFIPDAP
jgi:hypothetical protein